MYMHIYYVQAFKRSIMGLLQLLKIYMYKKKVFLHINILTPPPPQKKCFTVLTNTNSHDSSSVIKCF